MKIWRECRGALEEQSTVLLSRNSSHLPSCVCVYQYFRVGTRTVVHSAQIGLAHHGNVCTYRGMKCCVCCSRCICHAFVPLSVQFVLTTAPLGPFRKRRFGSSERV